MKNLVKRAAGKNPVVVITIGTPGKGHEAAILTDGIDRSGEVVP
jgi:hypothetical protein